MHWIWVILVILFFVWLASVVIGWFGTEFFHRVSPMSEEEQEKARSDPWYWEKKAEEDR